MPTSTRPKQRKPRTRAVTVIKPQLEPVSSRGPALFQSRLPYFAQDPWKVRFAWGLIELFTLAGVLCFVASVAAPSVGAAFGRMLLAVVR